MRQAEFDKLCDETFALLGERYDSDRARSMLWAIGRQESRMIHRRQINGPARGLWQFERGGGVWGVLNHQSSQAEARAICKERGVDAKPAAVYAALENDDVLALAFARLLLWTDPVKLPEPLLVNEEQAWQLYIRTWRPGKPHRHTWGNFWEEAVYGA